jgi:uncharacterized protein
MGKTLFWIAVFFAVLLGSRFRDEQARKPSPSNSLPGSEAMVQCAHCNIFLPRSEALLTQDETWCSQAHAQLGPRKPR